MNIVGFIGSPRISGNTAWCINKILEGAEEHGAKINVFNAGELDLRPCIGCMNCVKDGRCVIDDDMQRIYEHLKTADALVIGSPVYVGQMSAQAKIFTDRLPVMFKPRFSPTFRKENAGKKLVLVWTQGNPDAERFRDYFEYTAKMFTSLEFEVKETVVVSDARTKAASENTGLGDKLRNIGAELVRS